VFRQGGFDVVIGNPPYVQIQNFSGQQIQKDWERQNYKTFAKTGDIYCLFYEKGNRLLHEYGTLIFITSNKWMRANYGKKIRQYFLNDVSIHQLIDFGDSPIFREATTYTNILMFSKNKEKRQPKVWDVNESYKNNIRLKIILSDKNTSSHIFSNDAFILVPDEIAMIKRKIEAVGVPLKKWNIAINYGIKTGFNKAFIIDTKTKEQLCEQDFKSVEIIKPVLRGRDIKRYRYEWAGLWLINSHNNPPININDYPAIKKHLDSYYPQLEKRLDKGKTPYNLRNCAYLQEFEKEKLVYAEIVYDSAFSFEKNKLYPEATTFILTGENLKYLMALLNSKLLTYSFRAFYAGGDLRGKTFRYKKVFLEKLPIPKILKESQQPFIDLVDKILSAKQENPKANTSALESKIDKLVYQLYELTEEDIRIIETNK
jgi:hypothetical protein